MKNVLKGSIFYVIIAIIVVLGINYIRGNLVENTGVTYSQFQKYVAQNKVSGVEVRQNSQGVTGELTVHLKDGEYRTLDVSDVTKAEDLLEQKNISYKVTVEKESVFMTTVLPMLLICVIFMVFFTMGSRQATGGNARMMNFGKSRATLTMPDNSKVTFKDVAGLQEEKEDLQEIVDFLKEPKKYLQVGARIPKGVLLVGPPGTGKTLLAKAVAGEAGVPFFSISGSDFVEMFVGVGASRVRDMFTEAKLHAPCIIFIDEIDAVARRRGAGVGGGHDEREQTLNQMLVEMDGFGYNEGIIVMAATNRVDILDPAILRPGRFDRKIGVGRPDVRGREEILAVHIKNKPLGEDVDLKEIARTSAGFTGADLENLMNEAAILAVRRKKRFITMEDGATIILESSWAINLADPIEAKTTLAGTKVGADMNDGLRINEVKYNKQILTKPDLGAGGVDFYDGESASPADIEARQWIDAVINDKEPVVKPEQAIVVTQILEAIYESAKTGKEVVF